MDRCLKPSELVSLEIGSNGYTHTDAQADLHPNGDADANADSHGNAYLLHHAVGFEFMGVLD